MMEQESLETGENTLDAVDTLDTVNTVNTVDTVDSRERPSEEAQQLFGDHEVQGFRDDWRELQTAFVDDPQRAVREADELVAAVIQSLASTFAEHKTELESQWQQGEAPTEDLRVALRRYRSFFNQLLSA